MIRTNIRTYLYKEIDRNKYSNIFVTENIRIYSYICVKFFIPANVGNFLKLVFFVTVENLVDTKNDKYFFYWYLSNLSGCLESDQKLHFH